MSHSTVQSVLVPIPSPKAVAISSKKSYMASPVAPPTNTAGMSNPRFPVAGPFRDEVLNMAEGIP